MSKSLRDQLVAAGLATNKQAKQAEAATSRKTKGQASNSERKRKQAQKAKSEKAAKDRERELAEHARKAAKTIRAEIRNILREHDQRPKQAKDDDVAYNFLHNKKIKRIHIPKQLVDQLSKGQLVIINDHGNYHLVKPDVAQKIADRDPKRIIAKPDASNADAEMDDYYKKFEVPDDLDW